MVARSTAAAGMMVAFLSTAPADKVHADARLTDELIAKNLVAITAMYGKLNGKVDLHDETLELLKLAVAKDNEMMKQVQDLAKRVETMTEAEHQRTAFIVALIEMVCRVNQDNCELKRRMVAMEEQLRRQQNPPDDLFVDAAPPPEPTLAPPETTPADITPELTPAPWIPDGSLEPPPTEVPLEPTPSPWQPEGSLVPPPTIPPWDGTLDYFTDQRESFCQNAELVARCTNCQFADGSVHHGDVYLTCRGNYVLLRHAPRVPIQHVLVYR